MVCIFVVGDNADNLQRFFSMRHFLFFLSFVITSVSCVAQIRLPRGYHLVKPANGTFRDYFYSNNRISIQSDVYSQGQLTSSEIAERVKNDAGGDLILETKDRLLVRTGKRSDQRFHYTVYDPQRDYFVDCSSYTNDKEFQEMSTWVLREVRQVRRDNRGEFYLSN
jgi:hypothetical protein